MTVETTTKTLFQLSEEWQQMVAALEDAGGELTPELQAEWDRLTGALGDKVDAYGHLLRTLDLQSMAHKERAEYHAQAARVRQSAISNLKDRLAFTLQSLGKRKITGMDFTAYLRASEAVAVTNEADVPQSFWRIKRDIDRRSLLDALNRGETVPGAEIETRVSAYVR